MRWHSRKETPESLSDKSPEGRRALREWNRERLPWLFNTQDELQSKEVVVTESTQQAQQAQPGK